MAPLSQLKLPDEEVKIYSIWPIEAPLFVHPTGKQGAPKLNELSAVIKAKWNSAVYAVSAFGKQACREQRLWTCSC